MPSAACCPCGQLSGCTCGGVNCALSCRSKGGVATLCGFAEFADPSTPPKRYKKKTTSGAMTTARYGDAVCEGEISVAAGIECRSKAVTATLCGFSEYTSPSVPPKKYRKQTLSGLSQECNRLTTGCTGGITSRLTASFHYSGEYTYSASDCSQNNAQEMQSGALDFQPPDTPCGSEPLSTGAQPAQNFAPSFFNPASFTLSTNQTSKTWTGDNLCYFDGFTSWRGTGVLSCALTEEDTEAAAVARANADIGWTSGLCNAHTSYQNPRTSGFSFDARTAQTRVVVSSGLVTGENYEARVHIYRRANGSSGAFTDSGIVLTDSFTAAGAGHTGAWLDLPQDTSWEYRAEFAEVYGAIEQLTVDTWDIVGDFGPNLPRACSPDTDDNSDRTVDGVPDTWPWGSSLPSEAYFGYSSTNEEATERTTEGNGTCQAVGEDDFQKVSGTVTETLEDEDTEDDALERAVAAIADWSACALGCLTSCAAFRSERGPTDVIFGFNEVQTRVSFTAVIGVTYKVTIRFARRVLGTSGPYLFYSLEEIILVADATSEVTDWIDVPNEAGWDTIAANCSVEVMP